jgi:hypothetical protein
MEMLLYISGIMTKMGQTRSDRIRKSCMNPTNRSAGICRNPSPVTILWGLPENLSMSLRKMGNKILRRFAEGLENSSYLWVALFELSYLGLTLLRSFRPLWYDELITYNVANLGGLRAMWEALMHGADLNPPLFYVVTRAATALFGVTEFGLRVPSIAGFAVLCFCLYKFVAKRAGACYGFVAMMFPGATGAFQYSSEARAYGLVLGYSGIAILMWQKAAEDGRRTLPLAALSAALTAALLTHCYAVLLLVAFGFAQIVEDYRRRRFSWKAWVALTIPSGACLTYIPLLAAIKPYAVNSDAFRPDVPALIACYVFLLAPALYPLIAGAVVVMIARNRPGQIPSRNANAWPTREIALGVGLLLVPVFAFLLAKFYTGLFVFRYGLTAVVGMAILIPRIAAALTGSSRRVAAALCLVIWAWPIGSLITRTVVTRNSPRLPVAVSLDQHTELPLVISSGLIYYQMNHYASRDVANRMWYLTDEAAARSVTGTDVFDKGFPELNRIFPFRSRLEDYHAFLAAHHRFLVYGYEHYVHDWLVSQLKKDGARLDYLGQRPEQFGRAVLNEVQMPEQKLSEH